MEIIAKISEWKAAHDLPIFDQSREVEVIKNNLDAIENEVMREYYHTVLLSLLKVSKDYQKSLALEGIL
jgi:chorismate mutase